jgi:tRNA(Arg) A34 adenosine deaminase TadA
MCRLCRREFLAAAASLLVVPARAEASRFAAEAERMRREAVAAGDQSYGAVLVKEGEIIGFGPSRVIADRNPDAHAERVAMWEAERRLGRAALAGAQLYSTSIPCADCQAFAASRGVARMVVGPQARDAGAPRGR